MIVHTKDWRPAPGGGDGERPAAATALKAMAIFDLIAASDRPLLFREIAAQSGLPKATLHRMLSALLESGLIGFDPARKTYWLGMRILDLANRIWERIDLSGALGAELVGLRKISDETAHAAVLEGFQITYVDERSGLDEIRLFYRHGRRLPAYCTAMGKAILSGLPIGDVQALVARNALQAYTARTITTWPALQRELALVAERHYAVDDEEHESGQRCVAAPVLDHRGVPIAAIGITGPAERLTLVRCHALAPDIIAAAARVTERLTSMGEPPVELPLPARVQSEKRPLRCIFPATSFLPDSPVWCSERERLAWVDILAPAVHFGDPATGEIATVPMPSLIGSLAPDGSGGFVAALQNGFARLDRQGRWLGTIADPEADKPSNRFNDGKCDPQGRFWAGTMSMLREPHKGALYRLDPNGKVHCVETGLSLANGLGWSPDGRSFYLVDSIENRIDAYDFAPETGTLSNRRAIITLDGNQGSFAGLAIDEAGCLLAPIWDGGCILRLTPDGRIDAHIAVPAPRPAGVCFGGPDYRTLYVTTARIRMTARQLAEAPLSGSVFAVDLPVGGRPADRFGS